jgi:hypothetical protein
LLQYNVLEGYGRIGKELSDPNSTLTDDEKVKTAIERNWKAGSTTWIYEFDVSGTLELHWVTHAKRKLPTAGHSCVGGNSSKGAKIF